MKKKNIDRVMKFVKSALTCLVLTYFSIKPIENLLGTTNYNSSISQVRTLYDELTRILNHLLAIACHALDVGSMSSIF